MLRGLRSRQSAVILIVVLALITTGAGIWYTQLRCDDDLAIGAPNAELSFQRDASTGTLTVKHTGGDALLDTNNRTNKGCPEEFEPNEVSIVVAHNASNQSSQQYLWIARNGSGAGRLPLNKDDSVTLVEPEAEASGDIQLNTSLEQGDIVRVIGRSEEDAATFGKYIIEND
jgi:hypothetical protein